MVISGKKQISQMAGIGRRMPITMAAFTVGAVGMAGAPPVAGFISKWYLCLGTIQTGYFIFLVVILVSSLLDVIYFFPIVKTAFFDQPASIEGSYADVSSDSERERPLYLFMLIPLTLTALFSIVFCFFPGMFYIIDLANLAIKGLFP